MEYNYDITVLSHLEAEVLLGTPEAQTITHAISIGALGTEPPRNIYANNRTVLRLEFDDVDFDDPNYDSYKGPSREDVQAVIDFAGALAGKKGRVLVHCHAGISRSTAAAMILLYLKEESEQKAKEELLRIRPKAVPNQSMIRLADEILSSKLLPQCKEIHRLRTEQLLKKIPHLKDLFDSLP
ncbi:MAG: hypothetical protein GY754_26940 [bacterium]|nr:hypothetical protein [bacterium]